MTNLVGFFSSDARPLYKEDIYRTIALPSNSIIHFRYGLDYIQQDIVTNYKNYIGREGVIFFVAGNDLSIPLEQREKKFISIRKVIIRHIFNSEDTGHFHFSLELQNYFDCDIYDSEERKFVSIISTNGGIAHRWIDRVNAVRDYFEDILFFKYEIYNTDNEKLSPEYSVLNDDAIYQLSDETEYKLLFSFYDKKEGGSCLQISDSEHIDIHYKECSNIGAIIDDRKFKLVTKTIQQSISPDTLKIHPVPIPSESELRYEVVSFFEIKKGWKKTLFFGLLSTFVFISLIAAQIIGACVKYSKPIWVIVALSFIATISFGIAGALLFNKFNKR